VNRRLSHIGKDLQSRLKRLFDVPLDTDAAPLEICQAVLDEIERKLEPVGRGRRVFPYSRLVVRVRLTNTDRAALEAAFARFESRLRERLAELRCEPLKTLDVKVAVLKKAPADWTSNQLFAIEYQTVLDPRAETGEPSAASPVHITVVRGATARKAYSFTEPLISIGRTPDPTDEAGRVRRNRVAFLDRVDGITETVGRAHAHLRFDARAREYRLFDDGSSNGTSIVRDGASIQVPPRDPRGVRVCSGDEVQVGRAVIRIVIGPNEPAAAASKLRAPG
jgi:hypothetical protein